MNAVKRIYCWACSGPVRYVVVVGLGAYGITLGVALSLFLLLRGHAHGITGIVFSFALSEIAGLVFGLGMWLTNGRKVRKMLDGKASSGR